MDKILNLYEETHPGLILLKYEGSVSFEIIDSILFAISKRLDIIEKNVNLRKKVYSVLLECAQNLCFHAEQYINGSPAKKQAFLRLDNSCGYYRISTGNFIKNEKVKAFKELLDHINNKSSDQLKSLYNKVLTNNSYSPKGGGGLGLIDIARKSAEQLNYEFTGIDQATSYFILNVTIKS